MTPISKNITFASWLLVSAFNWVFWGFSKWVSGSGIQETLNARKGTINRFRTIVSEVSSFVDNHVSPL